MTNAAKSVKGSKDEDFRLVFSKQAKIASWSWWYYPKNPKPIPLMMSPPQISNSKLPLFFIRNYKTFLNFRGFEQLSSSIARRVTMTQFCAKKWRTGTQRLVVFTKSSFYGRLFFFTAPPTAAAVNLSKPAFESDGVNLNIMWTMPTYKYVVTGFNITLYSSTRERTDLSLASLVHPSCCSYTVTGLIIGETYTATVKAISHDVASPDSVESNATKACKLQR